MKKPKTFSPNIMERNLDLEQCIENDEALVFDCAPIHYSPRAELVKFAKPTYDEIAGADLREEVNR